MDERGILEKSRIIAVVGLSDKPDRPSYDVASYLMDHGYTVIPVNPNIKEWRGIKAYGSLREIPKSQRSKIDVVDIFRKSEDVPPIVEEAIALGLKVNAIWMQLGIVNDDAAKRASEAGMPVIMDRCMKIEHMKLVH